MLKMITHLNEEIYWFKCTRCSTYVVADKNHPRASEFKRTVCPFCCDLSKEDYPFRFITKEEFERNSYTKDSLMWLEHIEIL